MSDDLIYCFFVLSIIIWIFFIILVFLSYTELKRYIFLHYHELAESLFSRREILDSSISKDNALSDYMREKKYLLLADDRLSVVFSRYYILSKIYKISFYVVFVSFIFIFVLSG